MEHQFKKGDKVIHIISKKELIIVSDNGFYANNALYIPCADSENVIDDYNSHFFELKEKSTRELALEWWNRPQFNGSFEQARLVKKYYPNGFTDNIDKEIEEIWRKETQLIQQIGTVGTGRSFSLKKSKNINSFDDIKNHVDNLVKSNQKQFKECSLELVSKYFDKFSPKDLENKILPLLQSKIKTI